MAEIFPDEGLDYLLGIFPKNGTNASTLYLGLLTDSAAAGTTVPASTATLATMGGTFSETAYTSYARVAVASSDWGSAGADTIWSQAVRRVTATQKSFAAATAAAASAKIVGFFLCTVSTGTSGVVVYYSNFDNGATDVITSLAIGDIVRVTPKLGFGG